MSDKSLGKLAEEYDVPYSLVHAIDTRIRADSEGVEVEELVRKVEDCFFINCGDYDITCKYEELKQLLQQKPNVDNSEKMSTEITEAWINNVAYEMSAMSLDYAVAYLTERLKLRGIEAKEEKLKEEQCK